MGCGRHITSIRLPKTEETSHLYIIISGSCSDWREATAYVGLSLTAHLLLPQCVQPVTQRKSEKQLKRSGT